MTPYYLFTNGKLKKVEREEPDWLSYKNNVKDNDRWEADVNRWVEYMNSIVPIEVHPDLQVIWKEGGKYYEGKDFQIAKRYPVGLKYCDCAIPLPGEAEEPTYPLTAKQISDLWNAADNWRLRGGYDLNGKRLMPDKTTYLKQHFNITIKE